MSKSAMISQPRYMPSIAYLMRIAMVDVYVCYDNVQRVPRFVENRQRLINPSGGTTWASVSICSGSRTVINESVICSTKDFEKHKETIRHFYMNYPFYNQDIVDGYFNAVMCSTNMAESFLSGIEYLLELMGIKTKVWLSSLIDYEKSYGAYELMTICKSIDADVYVTGVNGSKYGMTKELADTFNVKLVEDNNVIEPQVSFFHHLFLNGLDYWKTEVDKMHKLYI
jgi:WbqC-like protein family